MAKNNEDHGIVKFNTESGEVRLSNGIIRRYLVSGKGNVNDQEVMMFLTLCRYQQLNPFLREAYLIKYSDNQPAAVVVGKDVFTQRAAKHEKFDGFSAGIYVSIDRGEPVKRPGSLLLPGEDIVGGWAEVHRKDWAVPITAAVSFDEYAGKTKEGELNRQWARMPATMIRKVALVQALREAFPKDFVGLYDSAEIPTGVDLPTNEVRVEASLNKETAAATPPHEYGGDYEGFNDDEPDSVPKKPPEVSPEQEIQATAKMCKDAVKLLREKKAITDEDSVEYEIDITELVKKQDLKALKARHNKLRDLYMEAVSNTKAESEK